LEINKKNVMIIEGSHRIKGNTSYITKKLKNQINTEGCNIKLFNINRLNIEHCLDCSYCSTHFGSCVIKDDMQGVYASLLNADVIIFAAPVYFNNVPSKLKVLIDRCQMIYMSKIKHQDEFNQIIHHGIGFIISVGGAKAYPNQFLGSELTLDLLYKNLSVKLKKHYCFSGTDDIKVEKREEEIGLVVSEINQFIDQIR